MVDTPFVQPSATPVVLEGAALEDFFHDQVLVPLTGLKPQLVRPGWQAEPPNIPEAFNNWMAFHIVDEDSDAYPWTGNIANGDQDPIYQLQRHEQFGVICSFYSTGTQPGSQARALAKLLRDNLAISQNREPLFNAGMGVIEVTAPQPAPVLMKERWLYRVDMTIRIRRIVVRNYPIETIQSVEVEMDIDAQSREIIRTVTVQEN